MTKEDTLNRLAKAANNIRSATAALQAIVDDPQGWRYIGPDVSHFLSELDYMLTGDDGDGGLDSLIKIVEGEL